MVYFFRAQNLVKIGHSLTPRTRASQLRREARHLFGDACSTDMLVTDGDLDEEWRIQVAFGHLRTPIPYRDRPHQQQCEWFRVAPDLLAYIESLVPVPESQWPTRPPSSRTPTSPTAQTDAQYLGRRGGLARAKYLSQEAKRAIGQRAARARWTRAKANSV